MTAVLDKRLTDRLRLESGGPRQTCGCDSKTRTAGSMGSRLQE